MFYYQKAYAGKIYRNVYASNVDISGKTPAEAEQMLADYQNKLLSQEATFKNDDKESKATLSETGISLDTQKMIDESYNIGRSETFLKNLISSSETTISKKYVSPYFKINQAKFENFTTIVSSQLNFDSVNASLAIVNGQVVVNPEKDGKTINADYLQAQIKDILVSDPETIGQIKPKTQTVKASVASGNFDLAKKDAENILGRQLTLKYNDKVFQPNRNDVGAWISFLDNNGQTYLSLDDSKIKIYLSGIAKNIEVAEVDRKINAPDNAVIQEGTEGKTLNYDKAIKDIKTNLTASNSQEIALETITVPIKDLKIFPDEGLVLGRFDGKYIDVNLTEQKLCRIESTQLIDCYPISSGKAAMPTPTGTFSITAKDPREYSYEYKMWMPWWEQFNGDYGIHELPETATWKEVPDHLGTPVSHGCVRLGVGPAQTVYDWTDIGTPVYIHK